MVQTTCDVLIIGAGAAGLRAAVAAASDGATVLVTDRGMPGRSGATVAAASDWMAYGAAFGHRDPRDSPEQHAVDIQVKGGLCVRPALAQRIAEDAPARLRDIESYGGRFDRAPDGTYVQVHSDGASYARACGSGSDTGPMMVRALLAECGRRAVEMVPGLRLVDLLRTGDGRCVGAVLCEDDGALVEIRAGAVVLATGGCGGLFRHNALPAGICGSGYAAALRAGARLANMEFLQVGPCISHPVTFALSGVFWRMGPVLTNGLGARFLERRVPNGVRLPGALHIKGHSFPFTVRNDSFYIDVAVYREMTEGTPGPHGGVFLDVSHNGADEIAQRADVPLRHLLERGVDIRREPVEFAPAVQHENGGVLIDVAAATDVPGLYAAGECAGGQHGADRPGGNALADTQVFGAIAGASAARWALEHGPGEPRKGKQGEAGRRRGRPVTEALARLGEVLWRRCTIVRDDEGLAAAEGKVLGLAGEPVTGPVEAVRDLRDGLLVARAILACARRRTESRGTHYRADHPRTIDPEWVRLQTVALDDDGALVLGDEVPEIPEPLYAAWMKSPERRGEPLLAC
jgi:fumarate reductase (CoM/CoB) subunit A